MGQLLSCCSVLNVALDRTHKDSVQQLNDVGPAKVEDRKGEERAAAEFPVQDEQGDAGMSVLADHVARKRKTVYLHRPESKIELWILKSTVDTQILDTHTQRKITYTIAFAGSAKIFAAVVVDLRSSKPARTLRPRKNQND